MKKKKRMHLQSVASLLLIFMGLIYALYIACGYIKGQREYASLRNEYTSLYQPPGKPEEKEEKETERNALQVMQTQEQIQKKHERKTIEAKLPEDAPDPLRVDWNALLQRNGDVTGWIDLPAVNISYPIVQAQDNDYYLHRDIDGNYLYAGSIFLDASCSAHFSGYHTILYGHNMRDGSMFARLKDFWDPAVLSTCRYFWILTPFSDILYEICSFHAAAPESETYRLRFNNNSDYEKWIRDMAERSEIDTGADLIAGDHVVTLSTCTDSSSGRIVLQGKQIWRKEKDAN